MQQNENVFNKSFKWWMLVEINYIYDGKFDGNIVVV